MGNLILILGGARSGKSTFAQQLANERNGQIAYIATAEGLDDEMASRIARHRAERPTDWRTYEIPYGIGRAYQEKLILGDTILLDCITLLVTNLMMLADLDEDEPDEEAASELVQMEINELLTEIQTGNSSWIVVSNEVGLGLVPPYPLGRIYRDLLGKVNQQLTALADEIYLMVAGIPVPIHSYRK
jgi:adenosylcobinamide kinase/adenosylcobinamide-phosphate guanylyltransferase